MGIVGWPTSSAWITSMAKLRLAEATEREAAHVSGSEKKEQVKITGGKGAEHVDRHEVRRRQRGRRRLGRRCRR